MLASGNESNRVPFKKISESPTEYVSSIQLPSEIDFKDPSLYKIGESHRILQLWRGRQARGEIPFQFRGVVVAAGRFGGPEYADGVWQGWKHPTSNVPHRESKSFFDGDIDVQLPPVDIPQDEDESQGDSSEHSSEDATHPQHSSAEPRRVRSLSVVITPPPTKSVEKKIISSDDESTHVAETHTEAPDPVQPSPVRTIRKQGRTNKGVRPARYIQSSDEESRQETASPAKRSRGRPKPSRRARKQQLATPGPSNTASPASTIVATPTHHGKEDLAQADAPTIRKSSRLRRKH